jgi:transposase-like protein
MRYGKNKQWRLLYCRTCQARFSERKGTSLFGTRLDTQKIVSVLAHISEGCGMRKTSRLAGVHRDTVTVVPP